MSVLANPYFIEADKITNFWNTQGLGIRASHVLAKAQITNQDELLNKLTTYERVLSLKNCGRLTAQEIWKFIEELREGKIPSKETSAPSYQGLSNRAKHVLEKLGIYAEQQLLQRNLTQENIFSLKNVGAKTCDEIWSLIEYLRINYQEESDKVASENILDKDVLLLGITISADVWDILTKISINQFDWGVRTRAGITKKNCMTLANIADILPHEWLALENFGRSSLVELQTRLSSIINNPSNQELPLLGRTIPQHIGYALRIIPIADIEWSQRTKNGLIRKNCRMLADIVAIDSNDWLQLENFGRTSLKELKEKILEVLTVLFDSHTKPSKEIQSLSELGQEMLTWLQERQQEVIKLYYGYADTPKTLEDIGGIFGLTRERIRQIKKQANKKLFHKPKRTYLTKTISTLISRQVSEILESQHRLCSLAELHQYLKEQLGWGKEEEWLTHWFNEALGTAWIFFGTSDYHIEDEVCLANTLNPSQEFIVNVTKMLKDYGYQPIVFDQCLKLYEKSINQAIGSKEFETLCLSHPHLKIYEYGEIYIGRKDWEWFVPETRDSSYKIAYLIEWFLRLTNTPASAKEIAYGIREKVGDFSVTAIDVIEACEQKPEQFSKDEEHRYHLAIWRETERYKDVITEILCEQPMPIQQIIQKLVPAKPDAVVAALHLHEECIEIFPFEWALKKDEVLIDLNNLTFEDLIPI